jgi:hypothetical protein
MLRPYGGSRSVIRQGDDPAGHLADRRSPDRATKPATASVSQVGYPRMPIDLDEDQILVSGVMVELIDDGPALPAVQPERLKPQRFTRLASPAVAPPRRLTLRPAGVLADGGQRSLDRARTERDRH